MLMVYDELEQIPLERQGEARALPDGKYAIPGEPFLAELSQLRKEKPPTAPPVKEWTTNDFTISAIDARDHQKYRKVSEAATRAGKTVRVVR